MKKFSRKNSLFKYISFNAQNEKYTKKLLLDNKIYLSSPKDFNDPFDCTAEFSFGDNEYEKYQYYYNTLKKTRKDLTEGNIKRRINHLKDSGWINSKQTESRTESIIKNAINDIGVLCLTKKPDNLLMWAHYSQRHTGICLQFNHKEGSVIYDNTSKVIYSTEYPKLNFAVDPEDTWKKILFTKSIQWEYEAEWRFIDLRGYGEETIPPDLIKGIIFGMRIPEENKIKIIRWYKDKAYRPGFYQAVKKEKEYGIDIKPYKKFHEVINS